MASSFVPYAEAEVSGLDNVKSMQMQTSGKAFFVIIAKIYSYKIRSMIREICCNASDIHKVQNQTKPFIVTLPSDLNPVLIVRDFGTGLSEDGMSLFTTVFQSSKEASDNETGYYGLGSKSPFAYTTSFNVVSYYNGLMSHYTVFLDGANEPKYAKVFEVPTEEPNGLEIQISVKDEDITKFANEACDVLSSFNVPYELIGAEKKEKYYFIKEELTKQAHNYRYDNKFSTVIDNNEAYIYVSSYERSYYSSLMKNDWYAQLGDVLYPIENSQLSFNLPSYYGIMKFNPKDLDIPPSRETLEYTPKTIEAIREKTAKIIDTIDEYFENAVIDSLDDLDFYSSQKLGKNTHWQFTTKTKYYFADNEKYDFNHDSTSGYDYNQRRNIKETRSKLEVWIYDTARSSQIFKQVSVLRSFSGVNVVTLKDNVTDSIVYSAKHKSKIEKLKKSLSAAGFTVYLASELNALVKLDDPKKRAFIYEFNTSNLTYKPVNFDDIKTDKKIVIFNSSHDSTEQQVRSIFDIKIFNDAKNFNIYKVQGSKIESVRKKLIKQVGDENVITAGEFIKLIKCGDINFKSLNDAELCYLTLKSGEFRIPYESDVKEALRIVQLYDNNPMLSKHHELLIKISNVKNQSYKIDKIIDLKFDMNNLKSLIAERDINFNLLASVADIIDFSSALYNIDINNTSSDDRSLRRSRFMINSIKIELDQYFTQKEENND